MRIIKYLPIFLSVALVGVFAAYKYSVVGTLVELRYGPMEDKSVQEYCRKATKWEDEIDSLFFRLRYGNPRNNENMALIAHIRSSFNNLWAKNSTEVASFVNNGDFAAKRSIYRNTLNKYKISVENCRSYYRAITNDWDLKDVRRELPD